MKNIIALILAAVTAAALFAACGTAKEYDSIHTLYFKDSSKSGKAVATFFNSKTGESEEVVMEKIAEDADSYTFSCEGDSSAYNMAYVTLDGGEIDRFDKFAFNPCVSGWYKTEDDLLPYTEGEDINYRPEFDLITPDESGFDKTIYVWNPDDYDPSGEKYSTVYVLDGQGFAFTGQEDQMLKGCPVITEQVKAMSSVTAQKAIVVLISSGATRDYEYVPEIGESADERQYKESHDSELSDEYDGMNGTQFAEYVARTLAPYIRKSYNVYPDALHTSITGASLGGLEAFYITMEYPDVFGTVGALSPSLWEYDTDTWSEYLSQKSFGAGSPFLYLYAGSQLDTAAETGEMYDRLLDMGYPEDKLVYHLNEEGMHDSTIWRNVYSEFLAAMVYQRIDPLRRQAE